jgi:hypothetical protein
VNLASRLAGVLTTFKMSNGQMFGRAGLPLLKTQMRPAHRPDPTSQPNPIRHGIKGQSQPDGVISESVDAAHARLVEEERR